MANKYETLRALSRRPIWRITKGSAKPNVFREAVFRRRIPFPRESCDVRQVAVAAGYPLYYPVVARFRGRKMALATHQHALGRWDWEDL
jgi:hypothetical protein